MHKKSDFIEYLVLFVIIAIIPIAVVFTTNKSKREVVVYDNSVIDTGSFNEGRFLVTYQEGDSLKVAKISEIKLIDEDKYYIEEKYGRIILYAPNRADENLSLESNVNQEE